MADKGKAKELDPIVLSDSDSDTDFFKSKRKVNTRPITPPRSPSPVRARCSSSDSDEDEDGKKKKRKRKTVPKPAPQLPAWTRSSHSHEPRGRKGSSQARGSTEERRPQPEAIVIEDSDEEIGKRGSTSRRDRVEVTPPPPISEKRKAFLRQALESRGLAGEQPVVVDDEPGSSSPPRDLNEDQIVHLTVVMAVDPARRASASEAAMREWQKSRTFKFCQTDPLSRLLDALADRLNQSADDLVLEYEMERVYNRTTPQDLGIDQRAQLSGYTKTHYQQVQKDRLARLLEGDEDDPSHTPGAGDTSFDLNARYPTALNRSPSAINGGGADLRAGDDDNDTPDRELYGSLPTEGVIRINVKGNDGEAKMRIPTDTKVDKVLRFYLKKVQRPKEDLPLIKLIFDGESLDREMTVGEAGIEDADMLEVQG